MVTGGRDRIRAEEREGEKLFFLFRVKNRNQAVIKTSEIECVTLINGSLSRRAAAEGEIYHLAVGGIFTLYFRCKYIKVHSPRSGKKVEQNRVCSKSAYVPINFRKQPRT